MLSRLRFKRDFKFIVRCLSEKPPENDGKSLQTEETNEKSQTTEKIDSNTEKIRALLKSMMAKPKITDTEYREKFTTAAERPVKPKSDEIEVKTEKIEESLTKAASEVAQAIGGNVKQTEAELLSKVLGKINQTSTSLSDLIVGMKVDRSTEKDEVSPRESRGQQVRRLVDKSRTEIQTRYRERKQQAGQDTQVSRRSIQQANRVDLFTGTPLGIFEAKTCDHGTKLDVWDSLERRELALATLQPPANYFQKMALWTKQGKVWQFPINNEQGMEEENNVHFSEHIFLDTHLEGWCPTKGPIRHFMELVCTGLSKNAFYTVKEKRDHILWYKEYFESKKELLTEVGAWEMKHSAEETSAST